MTYLKKTSLVWVLFLGLGLNYGATVTSAHADSDADLFAARVKTTKPKPKKPRPVKPPKGSDPAPVTPPDQGSNPVSGPVSGSDAKGAEVGLYNNADGSPIIPLIDGASATLAIEIYTMDDADVRTAIRNALSRSVKVTIVKEPDPLGACKVFTGSTENVARATTAATKCADEQALVNDVVSAGGIYVEFVKKELCGGGGTNCFQHGKIAIADGRSALVSTGNFDDTNLCDTAARPGKCDRDYTVITDDTDVVGALSQIVAQDALGKSYDVQALLTPAVAAKLTVSPFSMDPLTQFIASAKSTIQIQNQYLKDATLNAAIVAAAQNGVKVQVQVSSACAFGTPKATDSKEFTAVFSQFDRAGVSSSIFTSKMKIDGLAGYLHAKAIVVDGTRAWVGSVNGSTESLTRNREFGLFIDDADEVSKLSAVMSADFSDASSESWQDSLDCKMDR